MTNVTLVTKSDAEMTRRCGDCSLCCRLVPLSKRDNSETARLMVEHGMLSVRDAARAMPDFDKPAGERCPHQRHTGCKVYDRRPLACRLWNCRWLVNDDADELRRPDRSHYVLDVMPDFITLEDNQTGTRTNIQVVQVWCDPNYPDAHLDPALRRWLDRRGKDGIAAIIRYSSAKAFTLFPPAMSSDGQWHEVHHGTMITERSPEDHFAGIAAAKKIIVG
jgi:hypothetical protein